MRRSAPRRDLPPTHGMSQAASAPRSLNNARAGPEGAARSVRRSERHIRSARREPVVAGRTGRRRVDRRAGRADRGHRLWRLVGAAGSAARAACAGRAGAGRGGRDRPAGQRERRGAAGALGARRTRRRPPMPAPIRWPRRADRAGPALSPAGAGCAGDGVARRSDRRDRPARPAAPRSGRERHGGCVGRCRCRQRRGGDSGGRGRRSRRSNCWPCARPGCGCRRPTARCCSKRSWTRANAMSCRSWKTPAVLRAGNSGSVYFVVNGQTYGPAAPGAQVVKNVALSPEALTASLCAGRPDRRPRSGGRSWLWPMPARLRLCAGGTDRVICSMRRVAGRAVRGYLGCDPGPARPDRCRTTRSAPGATSTAASRGRSGWARCWWGATRRSRSRR